MDQLKEQFDWEKKAFGKRRETVDGFEVVNRLDKFIILGKPGAGKTTFIKRVALESIDQKLDKKRLPVFVSLKEFCDSGKSLIDFIVEQFEYCDLPGSSDFAFVEQSLLKGSMQILLDGLDEVSADRIDFALKEINDFTKKYDTNQFIISCRIAAYNYIFEQFTDVEMADFDEDQMHHFIQ